MSDVDTWGSNTDKKELHEMMRNNDDDLAGDGDIVLEQTPLLSSTGGRGSSSNGGGRDARDRKPNEQPAENGDTSVGFLGWLRGEVKYVPRRVRFCPETGDSADRPPNVIRNQKYSAISFFPVCLILQFRSFINLFYLFLTVTQFYQPLVVGFLFTYIIPLMFVIMVSMAKEGYDDFKRYKRDKEVNNQQYERLTRNGFVTLPAADMKVGHIVRVNKSQRVPADLALLRTTEKSGASFIRTDQLDGETDWKLRRAVPYCQALRNDSDLLSLQGELFAEAPRKDIYKFDGNLTINTANGERKEALSLENMLWNNTVLASGQILGLVVYTGKETRAVMNTSQPASKRGTIDRELNMLAGFLGGILVLCSVLLVAGNQFSGHYVLDIIRYIILLSFIVPISMSVMLDMAKLVYVWFIMSDNKMRGCVVRNTGLPEELGRISYLMSDKTGTLTQNEMEFKKLHLGTLSFGRESLDDIRAYVLPPQEDEYVDKKKDKSNMVRRTVPKRVREAVTALALCHNVTPVIEQDEQGKDRIEYQASSPDEVALVQFTESVGLTLVDRTFKSITLRDDNGNVEEYDVLNIFPFTSEKKRMGIVVREKATGQITFLMKGADVVMMQIVQYSDWLEEECTNLAREGLRTLCFGKKVLSEQEYERFAHRYHEAKIAEFNREQLVQDAEISLETDLELLGLTGVEDKLQNNVRLSLERLRQAGVKIWMLTGDKIETATCIAISSKLVSRQHSIQHMNSVKEPEEARRILEDYGHVQHTTVLVVDGSSLQICLDNHRDLFFNSTKHAPAVVCCRCSPTQKADVVQLIRMYTGKQTAAIGDGGNDVSMIQAADLGIGIEGKEGKQASMAADFSITQFSHVARLLLWHGRTSYNRSAIISQFVIHRGMLLTFVQIIFSAMYYWSSVALYDGFLMMGYSTWYTTLPIFALVLDEDVKEETAFIYPELYHQLQKGRALSYKTFTIWVLQSVYQASVIAIAPVFLYEYHMTLLDMGSFSFSVVVLMLGVNIIMETQSWQIFDPRTWKTSIVCSWLLTMALFFWTVPMFSGSFDIYFASQWSYWFKAFIVTAVATVPIYIAKIIRRKINPPAWTKVT